MIVVGVLLFLIDIATLPAAAFLTRHPVLAAISATIIYIQAVILSAFLIALGLTKED